MSSRKITQRYKKARLGWFGYVRKRDYEHVGRATLEIVPSGRRIIETRKQRWMDCVNRDTIAVGTTSDEVHDRTCWRRTVSAASPHD